MSIAQLPYGLFDDFDSVNLLYVNVEGRGVLLEDLIGFAKVLLES